MTLPHNCGTVAAMSDLKLNRLKKASAEGLILEHFGSCEVPAGCGGVVLRWSRTGQPQRVDFSVYVTGQHTLFVDGEKPEFTRADLAPGPHVLGLILSGLPQDWALYASINLPRREDAHNRLRSEPDGSWRCSVDEPADARWMKPGFDDSGWTPMIGQGAPPAPDPKHGWAQRWLQEKGARRLTIEGQPQALWVRRAFHVGTEGLS
ncbi:MAG: hypothetical protein H6739_20465 [Alphaproteobacteria bacterium]|nr:hypothetical protein [Alphaproteobacteria bacterium]